MSADGVDEINKMRDARRKRADEMESADQMKIWGVRWKVREGKVVPALETDRDGSCQRCKVMKLGWGSECDAAGALVQHAMLQEATHLSPREPGNIDYRGRSSDQDTLWNVHCCTCWIWSDVAYTRSPDA